VFPQDAIKQRFSAINVKKNQSLVKRGKTPEEALDIHNEITIITSNDSTFAMWSEVIRSHSQGEFLDPETNPLKKFKDNKTWRSEKEGVLNCEFFKWLGNLIEAYHRKFLQTHTESIWRKSCVCLPKGDDEDDFFHAHRLL
jgi:hypothetical protein